MAAIHQPLRRGRPFPVPHLAPRVNWWILAALGVFGVGAALPVLQHSTATSRGFEVQHLETRQAELNGEIRLLESDVARLTSLSRIQRRAGEIGLVPGDVPIYVQVDVAGPAPAKLPSEYLPGPTPQTGESETWLHSLFGWLLPGK